MSAVPEDLRYTAEHEWLRIAGDTATVGITDYAQEKLGEVIYVELPAVGKSFKTMAVMATVESVKAASDIYAPVAGTVIAVNHAVTEEPALLNKNPYGDAWLVKFKLADPAELERLLTPGQYFAQTKE